MSCKRLQKVGEERWKSVATVITVKARLPTRQRINVNFLGREEKALKPKGYFLRAQRVRDFYF